MFTRSSPGARSEKRGLCVWGVGACGSLAAAVSHHRFLCSRCTASSATCSRFPMCMLCSLWKPSCTRLGMAIWGIPVPRLSVQGRVSDARSVGAPSQLGGRGSGCSQQRSSGGAAGERHRDDPEPSRSSKSGVAGWGSAWRGHCTRTEEAMVGCPHTASAHPLSSTECAPCSNSNTDLRSRGGTRASRAGEAWERRRLGCPPLLCLR